MGGYMDETDPWLNPNCTSLKSYIYIYYIILLVLTTNVFHSAYSFLWVMPNHICQNLPDPSNFSCQATGSDFMGRNLHKVVFDMTCPYYCSITADYNGCYAFNTGIFLFREYF